MKNDADEGDDNDKIMQIVTVTIIVIWMTRFIIEPCDVDGVKFLDIRRDDDGGDVNVNIIVIGFLKFAKHFYL